MKLTVSRRCWLEGRAFGLWLCPCSGEDDFWIWHFHRNPDLVYHSLAGEYSILPALTNRSSPTDLLFVLVSRKRSSPFSHLKPCYVTCHSFLPITDDDKIPTEDGFGAQEPEHFSVEVFNVGISAPQEYSFASFDGGSAFEQVENFC